MPRGSSPGDVLVGDVVGVETDVGAPGDEEVTDAAVDVVGLLDGSLLLDEVQPATAAMTTSKLSAMAAVLRVTDTPTTGLQDPEPVDAGTQCAHFAL